MNTPDDLSLYYAELLDGIYDCVDRIVLNAFFPLGQTGGGMRSWWRSRHGDDSQLDDKHLREMAGTFARRQHAFCANHRGTVRGAKARAGRATRAQGSDISRLVPGDHWECAGADLGSQTQHRWAHYRTPPPQELAVRANPSGVRAMCAYLILRDKVIKPLLAGVVRPFGPAPKNQAPVDQHYVPLREELNRTFETIGLAAA
jgi:hypothetical protein